MSKETGLPILEVGDMSVTAALFFGAAIAHWDYALALSSRETTLPALRHGRSRRLALFPFFSGWGALNDTPADYAVMLGAFALNPHLQGSLLYPFLRFYTESKPAEKTVVLDAYYDAGLLSPLELSPPGGAPWLRPYDRHRDGGEFDGEGGEGPRRGDP